MKCQRSKESDMLPKKGRKSKENKCHIKPLLQIAAATSQQQNLSTLYARWPLWPDCTPDQKLFFLNLHFSKLPLARIIIFQLKFISPIPRHGIEWGCSEPSYILQIPCLGMGNCWEVAAAIWSRGLIWHLFSLLFFFFGDIALFNSENKKNRDQQRVVRITVSWPFATKHRTLYAQFVSGWLKGRYQELFWQLRCTLVAVTVVEGRPLVQGLMKAGFHYR